MNAESRADDWKVIYVSDPSSMTNYDFDPGRARPLITSHPTTPDELIDLVDNIAMNKPDTLIQEVYNAGWIMYFRSDRFEYDARPQHRRFLPMMDDGIMPLQVLLDRAHEHEMQFLAGFRLNDRHGSPDQGGMFIHKNPQWKIREMPPGTNCVPGNMLDFTFDGVRDYVFSVLQEVVDRFDVDGIELVFREGLYFPAPDGDRSIARERQPLMTGLIRRVRKMLDSTGRTRGRKLVLGVRVPQTLEECHNVGFDVPTWIDEQLIDYVAPQDTMWSDFNVQYDEFSSLTRATDCRLYPGMLPYCSDLDRTGPALTLENYRALVRTFRREGADGVSLYNFQMHWDGFRDNGLGTETNYPLVLSYMREIRDLAKVDAGGRHYLFHPMKYDDFGPPGMTWQGVFRDERIVLNRDEKGAFGRFRFRLYEDFEQLGFAKLFFRATGLGPYDRIEVDINGTIIAEGQVRHIWHKEGRSKSVARALPPHTTCILDLNAPPVIAGDNYLGVKLLFSGAVVEAGEVVVDEIEVTVLPRVDALSK